MNDVPIAMAIHGGAGVLTPGLLTTQDESDIHETLRRALDAGQQILEAGGSSLDAVEASVAVLEDSPWFNAGKGAVFTDDGRHELDAAIMRGSDRNAGAIAGVHHVRNPIRGARAVMECSEHVMLIGEGADRFLVEHQLPQVANDWYDTELRRRQWQDNRLKGGAPTLEPSEADHRGGQDDPAPGHKFGTVGAVALDRHGHVAAATSTGGITNKRYSRVGDTPLIGAGTWADDRSAAISATGHGEYFIRAAVAHDIAARMRHAGKDLEAACHEVVFQELKALGGQGGIIAVSPAGDTQLVFNTPGMYRAWRDRQGRRHTAIYAKDDRVHD
ncbi:MULTISPECIES: isoaspartyl peptidase/L-asparaginase [Modicisalibacter]|uniref:isoaspartyl peptidase/L-asparaginase family protein n=1 Tax=Modicisalibacter TaxID=574347 RepID=UPI00100BE342|nr:MULTISPECIES: isoaspartyl peptidase/L-asparaginase [Halomonadaceae]MBZ9557985.1 isoaspartyl peptidase/L-asparaginase [Modicisalibacter sp. R2A 31.J]MBZ9573347.1 isoaspartyl peptidase/L-asparaginase [Modicisalibacter sp. MOD 31.J]